MLELMVFTVYFYNVQYNFQFQYLSVLWFALVSVTPHPMTYIYIYIVISVSKRKIVYPPFKNDSFLVISRRIVRMCGTAIKLATSVSEAEVTCR